MEINQNYNTWRLFFSIKIIIAGNGEGIFKKIMTDHNLKSEDETIFQLGKGKLTSDPEKHSG